MSGLKRKSRRRSSLGCVLDRLCPLMLHIMGECLNHEKAGFHGAKLGVLAKPPGIWPESWGFIEIPGFAALALEHPGHHAWHLSLSSAVTIFPFVNCLPPEKNHCQNGGTSGKNHFHAATVDMEF